MLVQMIRLVSYSDSVPRAKIIRNEDNKGYGPAANQALFIAKTTYVLLINPDAIMNSSGLLNYTKLQRII